MQILITGGSGLIGSALTSLLIENGYEVHWLSHSQRSFTQSGLTVHSWQEPLPELSNLTAIVNLAGAPIFTRWHPKNRTRLIDSRRQTTQKLVEAINSGLWTPRLLISGSAMGYYGDRNDQILDESEHQGSGFLAELAALWEVEARQAKCPVVCVRTGLVLAEAGSFKQMTQTAHFGFTSLLGSGQQYVPWIHLIDMCHLLMYLIENPSITGAVNACAPNPCTMKDFMAAVANKKHAKLQIKIPMPLLALVLGELHTAVTYSQRGQPKVLTTSGFVFQMPTLPQALERLP